MLLPPTRAKGWVNARPQDMANLGARTAMDVAKLGARLATDMTTLKVLSFAVINATYHQS